MLTKHTKDWMKITPKALTCGVNEGPVRLFGNYRIRQLAEEFLEQAGDVRRRNVARRQVFLGVGT